MSWLTIGGYVAIIVVPFLIPDMLKVARRHSLRLRARGVRRPHPPRRTPRGSRWSELGLLQDRAVWNDAIERHIERSAR